MSNQNQTAHISVAVQRANVVLTLSPCAAARLASVLGRHVSHREQWVRDVARLLKDAGDVSALAREAVAEAADLAAMAALTARIVRAAGVRRTAEGVAAHVTQAATMAEAEADNAALVVARAAFDAAQLIASAVSPGTEREAAFVATRIATAVSTAAIQTAIATAAIRARVADEAAATARAAAVAAADAAVLVDLEVSYAAETIRAEATATALTLARETDMRATALALGHRPS